MMWFVWLCLASALAFGLMAMWILKIAEKAEKECGDARFCGCVVLSLLCVVACFAMVVIGLHATERIKNGESFTPKELIVSCIDGSDEETR